jgi:hypothetical protein
MKRHNKSAAVSEDLYRRASYPFRGSKPYLAAVAEAARQNGPPEAHGNVTLAPGWNPWWIALVATMMIAAFVIRVLAGALE